MVLQMIAVIYDPETGRITQTMQGTLANIASTGPYVIVDKLMNYDVDYKVVDGKLVPRDPAELLAEQTAAETVRVRNIRNSMLADTDWVELPSASSRLTPEKLTEYLNYRQALRDVTSQEGFPLNVVWPTLPN